MGTVYLATDPLIDRPVAVKVLRTRPEVGREEADEWHTRFEREVRIAGKLSHPNVVGILDCGLEGDTAFIVMEYVDGTDLEGLLGDNEQALPIPRILEICGGVADALDCAHALGIVHRDIKPGNILLTRDGIAKIADFGIAHLAEARMTRTGITYGTPAFMSPEQATARDIGPASDQFSLAALAYLMIAGEVPFSGSSMSSVLYRLINEEPVPPESIDPAVAKDLGTALLVGLSKNPAQRYPNCGALVTALGAAHQDTTTVASQPTNTAIAGGEARLQTTTVMEDALGSPAGGGSDTGAPSAHRSSPILRPREAMAAAGALAILLTLAWLYGGTGAPNEAASPADPVAATGEPSGAPQTPVVATREPSGASQTAAMATREPSGAAATAPVTSRLPDKLAERAENASIVLTEVLGVPEGLPQRLFADAHCIAVIPGVIKVGFGFGGRHGKGLVSCRIGDGWSSPSFVSITGGSFGLQIGAQSTDLVLLFATRRAAEILADNKITLGGDASVSAGPVGRTAEAGTTVTLETEIYSYSRSKGLFAGVSLEGATLRADNDANHEAYGDGVRPADLFSNRRAPTAAALVDLVRTLEAAGR